MLTTVAIILQLIFLEGILSIDNAAVLGAMVAHLPDDIKIEWPLFLASLGALINRFAGSQRTAALRVGLLGAYLGRGLMLLFASLVIQNQWLKLIGALYLIRLAFENLGQSENEDEEQQAKANLKKGFWLIVLNIEIADLIFSLDNVVAAVSLSRDLWVVMLGVAIGILTMRFAAGIFSQAILKEPILETAAYILVLNIGIQLILEDLAKVEIPDLLRFGISLSIIALALLYAHSTKLQMLRPLLLWIARRIEDVNKLIDFILRPIQVLFGILLSPFQWMLRKWSHSSAEKNQ